jgi:hypothetical protein
VEKNTRSAREDGQHTYLLWLTYLQQRAIRLASAGCHSEQRSYTIYV